MKNWRKIVIMLVLIAAVALNAHASDKKVMWKLAMTWGQTLHPFTTSVESMAQMVEKMSDGNFIIRIDSANRHKSPFGVLDMVKAGQYEMAHTASYYWKGKDVNLLPFTTMPFGMTAPEQYAWFYYGGGMELMQLAYAPHNMYSFPGGNTGNQMGGWFRKEINTLDDLKGLKMRIPGFAGEVLAELGTVVTNIAPGELYTALERGTIDALEWVGPGMDIKLGFHKVAPYYYTGWHEPATELQYLVNQKAFEALPENYKEMLRVAMRTASYDMYAQNYHESAIAWDAIATEYPHIKIKTFSKDIIDAMKAANQKLLKQMSDEYPLFKETIESQAEYQKKARVWTQISDFDYLKDNLVE